MHTTRPLRRPRLGNPERIERLRQMHVSDKLTADDIFWMQVDLGRAWLQIIGYTDEAYQTMRDSPVYWEWVRTMWDMHDLRIMSIYEREKQVVDKDLYWRYHRTAILDMYPNSSVMSLIFPRKRSAYVPEKYS
jgi:hypothetical protein